jgi:hypothetical protein
VKNPDDRLRPALACRAQVWLPPISDALVVPVSAIGDHDGRSVVTVIRDGKAEEIGITLGKEAEGCVQVVSGLAQGDLVAIKGGYGLPDGYPVEIVSKDGSTK